MDQHSLNSYERAALVAETERLIRRAAKVVAVGAETQAREVREISMERFGVRSACSWFESLSNLDLCAAAAAQSAQVIRRLRSLIASGESRREPVASLLRVAEQVESQTRFAMARGALTCTAELASLLRRRAASVEEGPLKSSGLSGTLRGELDRLFESPEWPGLVAYREALDLLGEPPR